MWKSRQLPTAPSSLFFTWLSWKWTIAHFFTFAVSNFPSPNDEDPDNVTCFWTTFIFVAWFHSDIQWCTFLVLLCFCAVEGTNAAAWGSLLNKFFFFLQRQLYANIWKCLKKGKRERQTWKYDQKTHAKSWENHDTLNTITEGWFLNFKKVNFNLPLCQWL